jgi:PPOX class probable F420-dependent enzyme
MPKASTLSPGAVRLLQEPQLAHFITLMADGTPQPTPVWVDVEADGSYILINTADARVKTQNIDRDPRVAVSVADKANDFRFVVVRGTVVERIYEGADAHIDALAKKYLGVDIYPGHTDKERRVILRIKPDHVMERGV